MMMVGLFADSGFGASGALSAFALLAAKDKVPNEAAQALSPNVGWALLVGAIAMFVLLIVNSERVRRFWLTTDDPRTMAFFRIVFGFFVICNVNDFWEYFTFLFTDEGIFTADVARQVHASAQFKGFGDGFTEEEPWGFFDFWGFVEFLKGPKWSLLYFWDTPTFFWCHLWAFEIIGVMFMLGFWTRTTGVLTFLLMNSIFFRNHLFWEGTELVYRVFLAYLICAKSGHAWSIDNWLRCRKLARRGLLSTRDGPGGGAGVPPSDEHPKGLQAIYRLIPAWPRRLMIFQLGAVYATTGILKNGGVWAKGDAIYYALNMDHFYRFYPQRLSAIFGTNVMRLMTWFTHWGEAFFWVAVLGVLIHWAKADGVPPNSGVRRLVTRLCWFVLILVTGALIWITWPVHFVPAVPVWSFVGGWVALLLGVWWFWARLHTKPIVVPARRAAGIIATLIVLAGAGLVATLAAAHARSYWKWGIGLAVWLVVSTSVLAFLRKRKPGVWEALRRFGTTKIDHLWIARWVLGRRIWIPWHFAVMGGIFVLMNIGMFQTGMLATGIFFLHGRELAVFLRWCGRGLARIGVPMPESVKRGEPPLPHEDPALPHLHRDAVKMPQWAMFATIGMILAGILVKVLVEPEWNWLRIWYAAGLFAAGVAFQRWRSMRGRELPVTTHPETGEPRMPWAYGPLGRFLIGTLLVWHITAITTWLLPDKDSLHAFRGEARKVFAIYLTRTQTDQGWGMFAPNPPRSNVFLKVLVHDADGEVYDMRTDVYAEERKPIPWIWNDRMRKMNRRIIGGESGDTSWYRKWHARYYCRKWALDHDGVPPKKIELVKVWYKIPSPEQVRDNGFYVPEELLERTREEKVEYTEVCKNAVMGQLPDWVRERHGLSPLPENEKYKPWIKHKKKAWERARAKLEEEEKKKEDEKEEDQDGKEKDPTRNLGD